MKAEEEKRKADEEKKAEEEKGGEKEQQQKRALDALETEELGIRAKYARSAKGSTEDAVTAEEAAAAGLAKRVAEVATPAVASIEMPDEGPRTRARARGSNNNKSSPPRKSQRRK